ncbi:MAG: archease, partial [Candidatus Helarchaeota archaeon]
MGEFRFLEHISDVYIEAIGSTLEEAFIQAAY